MANAIWLGPVDGPNAKALLEEGECAEAGMVPGSVADYAAAGAGFELMDDAGTTVGKPLMVTDRKWHEGATITTEWTVGENMSVIKPRSGEFIQVQVVTGLDLDKGTPLMRSGTPGALTIATPLDGTDVIEIVAYSDEDKTTSGTELVRVRVA